MLEAVDLGGAHDLRHTFATWLEDAGIPAVQRLVDRRFNRRRYDATRTIDAFTVRLRDQVDLDTLTIELLTVVDQTVEPTTSSLLLRPQATPERSPVPVRSPPRDSRSPERGPDPSVQGRSPVRHGNCRPHWWS
jgi:hypothetical protein